MSKQVKVKKEKRVVVDNKWTYATTLPVKVGDKVVLPGAGWYPGSNEDWEGIVTSTRSDYDGPVRYIKRLQG